jgi:hypothetical protein
VRGYIYFSNEFSDGSIEAYKEVDGHMYRIVVKDDELLYYGPSPWTSHEFLLNRPKRQLNN